MVLPGVKTFPVTDSSTVIIFLVPEEIVYKSVKPNNHKAEALNPCLFIDLASYPDNQYL